MVRRIMTGISGYLSLQVTRNTLTRTVDQDSKWGEVHMIWQITAQCVGYMPEVVLTLPLARVDSFGQLYQFVFMQSLFPFHFCEKSHLCKSGVIHGCVERPTYASRRIWRTAHHAGVFPRAEVYRLHNNPLKDAYENGAYKIAHT